MYDVIIVGGGPSGASAGRRAGKLGLKTLLLEKETFPRDKPCGGALSEHAISYLDFELSEGIIERNITGAKVLFKDNSIEKHRDFRVSTLVTRSVLDNYLLEKARETGIEIHTGEKVLDCTETTENLEVRTKSGVYQAKFAIIAEGAHGVLKTKVRPKDARDECGVCVVTEVDADDDSIKEKLGNAVEIQFGVAGGGYGWVFPHRGYYSVGIGGDTKTLPHPKQTMLDFLKANGFNGEYKLRGHKIPLGGIKRRIAGSRILLSGDSAGFVDAFSGEGLAYAIRSGQLAADTVADVVLNGKKPGELKRYESLCQKEFGAHLKYSLIFSRLMHRFPDRTFRIFTANEKMLDRYLDVMAFKINYKDYLKWVLFNFKLR